ncbi:uncharacterized protein BHQ10_004390 [Talaromyces amestolkiae]|uniref:Oxidase ustYa n=1 Tax=Talaromyces amestolkiae TaxID=1196081 RepID=A0A364KXV0_TALAM|nr:uncharacterized protein BHQ10_004390 [Talaromyces amestolkiae]RAO68378.1 hypothetical protein BHQ10_004390 [Talaromyces amestolkiae]
MLIASIVIWYRVALQLKKFSCDVREEDNFEPDLRFSSRVTFQPHHFYGGPPTDETNEMWRMLEPPGDGIVTIPKQYTKDLHPSLEDKENPNNLIYGVSMFHQLHCLNFLRLAYFDDAIKDLTPEEIPIHRDHCLNYIRQAIMCNGDATFESVNHQGVLDGMGATHQCRNFELIFSWAYEHRQTKNGAGYKPEEILTHSPAKQNNYDIDE